MNDIKKAYYALVKQHHPDVNQNDANAEENFKLIVKLMLITVSLLLFLICFQGLYDRKTVCVCQMLWEVNIKPQIQITLRLISQR